MPRTKKAKAGRAKRAPVHGAPAHNNPMRADPTRTTTLRRAFVADARRRFVQLGRDIRALVGDGDAFGLSPHANPTGGLGAVLATNERWRFETDDKKLDEFRKWLKQQTDAGILEVDPEHANEPWLAVHVRSAYQRGITRAWTDAHAADIAADTGLTGTLEGGKQAFLDTAFTGPVATQRLRMLYTRSFSQMEGVTAQMDQQLSRVLADGLARGTNPRQLAKQMEDVVLNLEATRARAIARTEVVHAHNEGQLDSFEAMNIDEVGVMAEWQTAGDSHVCPLCAPLEGTVYKTEEAHGLIPRHPNCRCTWLPALPEFPDTGQVFSGDEIRSRIRESIKKEHPKLKAKEARKASRWVGADAKIADKAHLKPGTKAYKKAQADAKKAARAAKVKAKRDAARAVAKETAAKEAKAKAEEFDALAKKLGLKSGVHYRIPPGTTDLKLTSAGVTKTIASSAFLEEISPADIYKNLPGGPAALKTLALDDQLANIRTAIAKAKETAKLAAAAKAESEAVMAATKAAVAKWKGTGFATDALDHGDYSGLPGWGSASGTGKLFINDFPTTDDTGFVGFSDWTNILHQAGYDEDFITATGDGLYAAQKHSGMSPAALSQVLKAKGHNVDVVLGSKPALGNMTLKDVKYGPGKTQSYGVIIFDDDGRVLMREPKGHFGGATWTFAKGGGTLPGTTAQAELGEETGHQAHIFGLLTDAYEGTTTKTNYFIGKSSGYDGSLMDEETQAVKWMTYDEALAAIQQSTSGSVRKRDTAALKAAYAAAQSGDSKVIAGIAKSGADAAQAAKVAAEKAAHSHKVKLGMAQKHYAKPKFGGGVVAEDWVNPNNPTKLQVTGLNKVLSEKGWHASTLPSDTLDALFAADDVVAQKAIMDKLKKAKGTAAPKPTPTATTGAFVTKDDLEDVYGAAKKGLTHIAYAGDANKELEELIDTLGHLPGDKLAEEVNKWKATKPEWYGPLSPPKPKPAAVPTPKATINDPLDLDKLAKFIGEVQDEGPDYTVAAELLEIFPPPGPKLKAALEDALGDKISMKDYLLLLETPTATPKPIPAKIKWMVDGGTPQGVKTSGNLLGSQIDTALEHAGFDPDGGLGLKLASYVDEAGDAATQGALLKQLIEGADPEDILNGVVPGVEAMVGLPSEGDLKKLKNLPGSTKPWLGESKVDGSKWVVKDTVTSGIAADHLRSETRADALYRIMGHAVPNSHVIETPSGPMKIAEFLEGGQTLAEWQAGKTAKQVADMHKQIRRGFVADALLANHDVAGMSFDNIFVVGGKAIRIDNGGALRYRAQGLPKGTWGGKVVELTTMRDGSINPQTAAIYKGITDKEINDQILEILTHRDELLAAIPDASERKVFLARLDYLEAQVPPGHVRTRAARTRTNRRQAFTEVAQDTTEAVHVSKSNGVTIAGDRGDIEDNNILVWQETDTNGKPLTRVQLKVTGEGSKKIETTLGNELQRAKAAAPVAGVSTDVHPDDNYWSKILAGIKTVNVHAGDGAYNEGTIATMKTAVEDIKKQLKKATGAKKKMLLHYEAMAEDVLAAKAGKTTTKAHSQYKHKPPKKKTPEPETRRDFRVRADSGINFRTATFKDGDAIHAGGVNHFSTREAYVVETDDASIKFIPRRPGESTKFDSEQGLAMHGTVSVTVEGAATPEKIREALNVVDTLGVSTAAPDAAWEEALYLHRGVYMRGGHRKAAYKEIWEADIPDAEKVKKLKAHIKKTYKIDVDKVAHYDPDGEALHADGGGHRHWWRWDISRQQMHSEMKDYALQHTTGSLSSSPQGAVAGTLRAILGSGGEFTSTTGRIRKGVSVGGTGGASSSTDITTGGASYFFTRIRKADSGVNGFFFAPHALARQDMVSYSSDKFGAISAMDTRAYTPAKMKQYAGNAGNEALFKEGMGLDDLDFIRVRPSEKKDVVKAFHDAGITHLPDGRKVEDIITTTNKAPKARKKPPSGK